MNKQIRVAHLVNFMSPAGKEMGIVKLLNGMDNKRFKGYLIVFDKIWDTLALDTDKSTLIAINKKRGNDFGLPARLAKILKKEKIDIVHTHSWGTLVEGVLGAKMARCPVVIHGEHGTFFSTGKRKWVQQVFWRWSDYLLSVSEILARKLENATGLAENSFYPILNGVDMQKFKPDTDARKKVRAEFKIDDTTIVIGTVGRTMKVKNHPLMIRAAKILKDKHIDFKMIIVGDSPMHNDRDALLHLIDTLDVGAYVEMPGKRTDIADLLNAFDIFLLPSYSEGCSNVIQEAMAVGLPVVATDVGGNPELVLDNKTGYLFPSDDANICADELERLILDKELRDKFGLASLSEARSRFSLKAMIDNYQNFYLKAMDEVLAKKR